MKSLCLSIAVAALGLPAHAGTDVGVSIGIGQPGMYGRIDIGHVAVQPVLVYARPVLVTAPAVRVVQPPIYLRVPPGHAKHWHRHCGSYNACGQPVYFVQEGWYQQHYADGHGRSKGHGKHGG
jgi:hypothetical protein